jgi:hypothetical protein
VRLVHVPEQRRGEDFAAALAGALADLPPIARRTLTWDQGAEMARHDLLDCLFAEGVYFAYAGSPWQRGTNENTVSVGGGPAPVGIHSSDCARSHLFRGWPTPNCTTDRLN